MRQHGQEHFFCRAAAFWMVALAALIGVFVGLSFYTFSYAEGLSYFSDDPNSCMNCHVMRDQFESWNHSNHKACCHL